MVARPRDQTLVFHKWCGMESKFMWSRTFGGKFAKPSPMRWQKFDEVVAGYGAGHEANDVMEKMIKLSRAEDHFEDLYDAMEPPSPRPALPSSRGNAKRCAPERSLSCP